MSFRLSAAERAKLDDCICPQPKGITYKRQVSRRALIVPILIFFGVTSLIAWFSIGVALWLLAFVAVLALGNMVVRAVRGHVPACVLVWGPVGVLYWMGEHTGSAIRDALS